MHMQLPPRYANLSRLVGPWRWGLLSAEDTARVFRGGFRGVGEAKLSTPNGRRLTLRRDQSSLDSGGGSPPSFFTPSIGCLEIGGKVGRDF